MGDDAEGQLSHVCTGHAGATGDAAVTGTRFGVRGSLVSVHLADWERRLLAEMVNELRSNLLDHTPARDGGDGLDPSLRRLFPPAYLSDPDRDAEYQRLMRDELLAERLEHLEFLDRSLDEDHLDDEQVTAWMRGLNELRLVIGTQLDISEEDDPADIDPDDPAQRPMLRYHYLGGLLAELIEAAPR